MTPWREAIHKAKICPWTMANTVLVMMGRLQTGDGGGGDDQEAVVVAEQRTWRRGTAASTWRGKHLLGGAVRLAVMTKLEKKMRRAGRMARGDWQPRPMCQVVT